MAITQRTFGSLNNPAPATQQRGSQYQRDPNWVASEFWLNIGYQTVIQAPNAQGELVDYDRFITIGGIALDSYKELSTSKENLLTAIANGLTNELYEEVMATCRQMQPGQAVILPGSIAGIFQIQLRRKNADKAELAKNEHSAKKTFSFKLDQSAA